MTRPKSESLHDLGWLATWLLGAGGLIWAIAGTMYLIAGMPSGGGTDDALAALGWLNFGGVLVGFGMLALVGYLVAAAVGDFLAARVGEGSAERSNAERA